jgi:hypothetical protein
MNEAGVFILAPVLVVLGIAAYWAACQRNGGSR